MKTIFTEKAPAAVGPYSQAKVVNGLLFASGQIPLNPASGSIVAGGIVEQTEQVCKNIDAVLAEAGSDFSEVIKTTCFLADIADFKAFNEVYAKYFTSKPLVALSQLHWLMRLRRQSLSWMSFQIIFTHDAVQILLRTSNL